MNLPELCIRRPVMTTLLMAAFMIFGIAGYRQLPVSALPKVDFPTISVTSHLPGASPEIMGATVATQLPEQPSFKKINPAEQPVIFLSFYSDTLPLSVVDDYAENTVAQRLSTLNGVSQVQVHGQQQAAVRIQVNPEAM